MKLPGKPVLEGSLHLAARIAMNLGSSRPTFVFEKLSESKIVFQTVFIKPFEFHAHESSRKMNSLTTGKLSYDNIYYGDMTFCRSIRDLRDLSFFSKFVTNAFIVRLGKVHNSSPV